MPARAVPPAPSDPDPAARRSVPGPSLPPRGRHPVPLARVQLRRVAVPHARVPSRRVDRRREQLPLPPGFVDRRAA
ncbi:MAG: hypothetical protein KDK70_28055 [Myxococcales bacterium]|nr:hypothetical protein [Myxococcales bacterium]